MEEDFPLEKANFFFEDSLRWRVVGFLEGGATITKASEFYKMHKATVSRLWTKFKETGSVEDKPRSGRLRKIPTLSKEEILSKLNDKFSSAHTIVAQMDISKHLSTPEDHKKRGWLML